MTIRRFSKYHALGNDYLVVEPGDISATLTPADVRRICDRHYGIGSDGLLFGPLDTPEADFALKLYNPDGSVFEKSGNGLRIFARYLWDTGRVSEETFTIATPGGLVTARVHPGGGEVTVDMGRVSFDSQDIPVTGPPREVLDETIEVAGQVVRYSCATIGNPHCVVPWANPDAALARALGPLLESAPRFPNRTNVQLVQVMDRSHLRIEIWERGAGYTLASGSSACAAAAVAHRLGQCGATVEVQMPGGTLQIEIRPGWQVTMTGAVVQVCAGTVSDEVFAWQASAPDATGGNEAIS